MAKLKHRCKDLAVRGAELALSLPEGAGSFSWFECSRTPAQSAVPLYERQIVRTELLPPSTTNETSAIPAWLRQSAYVVGYVWGFALLMALGTRGCDWISEPSSTKVVLGLASVGASIFGAAVLVSLIVRKIIETGRSRRG